jgi:hypothetical protein
MGCLRRTIEETVLKYLFRGTVTRWEDRIKIANIKDIAWSDDVADEIYGLFESLSRHVEGHSHTEAYETPPEPEDLRRMIGRVQAALDKARANRRKQ